MPRDLFELNTVCSQTRCGEIWLYGWRAAKYRNAQVGFGNLSQAFENRTTVMCKDEGVLELIID